MKRVYATVPLTLILACLLGDVASCSAPPTSCISRGSSASTSGIAAYTWTSPNETVRGSVYASVIAYDLTPGCWYPDMEFKVVVGSCALWLQSPEDSGSEEADASDSGIASATVVAGAGAPCELPVSEGMATVSGLRGELSMGPALRMTLSGELLSVGDAAVTVPETLSWAYAGD